MTHKEISNKMESIHDYLCLCAENAWKAHDREGYNMAYLCMEKAIMVMVWLAGLEDNNDRT